MPKELPSRPHLDVLRKEAKALRRGVRNGDASALARVADVTRDDPVTTQDGFTILDAQRVIAREYGFTSWPTLRREVLWRRADNDDRRRTLLRAALQGDIPTLAAVNEEDAMRFADDAWLACARGDAEVVKRRLARDPDWAQATDGPKDGWTPLHYVARSRLAMRGAPWHDDLLTCAGLLLASGADVNATYTVPNWPQAPQSVLYHAVGENDFPALAERLLERGAEVHDGESLYHGAEHHRRTCLELLRRYGGDPARKQQPWNNTPLFFLCAMSPHGRTWPQTLEGIRWLLDNGADPNTPCEDQDATALHQAILHGGDAALVELLLAHGADPNRPRKDGATPMSLAVERGLGDVITMLEDRGGSAPPLEGTAAVLAAARRGEVATAQRLAAGRGFRFEDLECEEDRRALVDVAMRNRVAAMRALLAIGYPVDWKGDQEWGATPLHWAAWHGQTEAVLLLLEHGARVDIPANPPEDSPVACWTAHGSAAFANPRGDYVRIAEAIVAAGAIPTENDLAMATPEVAAVLARALPEE